MGGEPFIYVYSGASLVFLFQPRFAAQAPYVLLLVAGLANLVHIHMHVYAVDKYYCSFAHNPSLALPKIPFIHIFKCISCQNSINRNQGKMVDIYLYVAGHIAQLLRRLDFKRV